MISLPVSRLAATAACLVFLCAGGRAWAVTDGWRVFRSAEGGFRVEMPDEPSASESVDKSILGSVTTHLFTARAPNQEFTAEYSELPKLALALGGPTTILKKAKEALLKDVRGEAVTFRILREKGNDRAELSYVGSPGENPDTIGFARFFVRGSRIFVLHVILSGRQAIDPETVSRFFGSFRADS